VRILIVDDSAFMRRSLSQLIGEAPDLEIVGTANNGQDAIEKIKSLNPDLVTMDVEMPVMDGLQALRQLKRELADGMPSIIMVSTTTSAGSANALLALRLGAADFVTKDLQSAYAGAPNFKDELLAKLRAISGHAASKKTTKAAPAPEAPAGTPSLDRHFELVVIGSSTGGPPVVEQLLSAVPEGFTAPIIVAQHMPKVFTESMTKRLNEVCQIEVVHAEPGMTIEPGKAYIAPGALNTRVRRGTGNTRTLEINELPASALYRPNVNELFGSAAAVTGGKTLAIMLTGMGDDGLIGTRALHATGATVLAQSADTCVVYGMPRAVAQAHLVHGVGSPTQLAEWLASVNSRRVSAAA
jgi:two-component system, chemotaxis family, protein-glutamate methylesterase/glutaminase